MRLCVVLLGMALALAACSSHPATQATAEAPIVPLVAEEAAAVASTSQLSDAQIAREIVAASIAGYSGSCPCPYSQKRNGARCGKGSAHDRPGGAVICYPQEVTAAMIETHRAAID
jgi:hypothetical protein